MPRYATLNSVMLTAEDTAIARRVISKLAQRLEFERIGELPVTVVPSPLRTACHYEVAAAYFRSTSKSETNDFNRMALENALGHLTPAQRLAKINRLKAGWFA